eukprot:5967532-Pyramimonas_sp.AAC.1
MGSALWGREFWCWATLADICGRGANAWCGAYQESGQQFLRGTASGVDNLWPRYMSLLPDGSLEASINIMRVAEPTGELPPQMTTTIMPGLPKPEGGHRVIGLLTGTEGSQMPQAGPGRVARGACQESSLCDRREEL